MGGLFKKLFKKHKEESIIPEDEIEEESQDEILERYRYENRIKKLKEENENLDKEEPILNGLTLTELRKAITQKGNEIIKNLNLDRFDVLKSTNVSPDNAFYVSPEKRKIFEIFKYI